MHETIGTTKQQAGLTKQGLTKHYLEILEASQGDKYVVTVRETSDGLWAVAVKFERQEVPQLITTARGKLKIWRNILNAITFVQENCASASNVDVEIGGWRLSRDMTVLAKG